MEERLHFHKEVDDLSKIDEFFRNSETPPEYTATETQHSDKINTEQQKSA